MDSWCTPNIQEHLRLKSLKYFIQYWSVTVIYVIYLLSIKDVQFKQNGFHFRHLGKDLNRAQPVMSDVPNCVWVTLIFIKVVLSMQKIQKFAEKYCRSITIQVGATCWFRPFAFDCHTEQRKLLALTVCWLFAELRACVDWNHTSWIKFSDIY